jgi:hypothetical protein
MLDSANREQRHNRAIMLQAIERASADHGRAMHHAWIDAQVVWYLQIDATERIERDGEAARSGAGQS